MSGCSFGKPGNTETPSTKSPEPGNNSSTESFDYSDGIDDNGFWVNIKASDHVEIKDYKGIPVPSDIHTVTDETIKAQVDSILSDYVTKKQITDRAAADGDTINIDYVGRIDGIPFEGGSTDGRGTDVTIGITPYIDDFLEQIIGHTPGETFDVEVTFPEDYGVEELNGKDAVFTVTLNYIVESVLPELSDEFVAENLSKDYGWNTVSEMETEIRDRLQRSAVSDYIQERLFEIATVKSVPDSMLKYQENYMIQSIKDEAGYYNISYDDFLVSYIGVKNTDELLELYYEDNKRNAELYLIFQAIAELENITVAETDVAEYFKKYIGIDDYSPFEESLGMPYLKLNVLNQAVMDFLQDNAVLQ
ncbi:MAG TPA: trigger factor [Clostridiaceae bacterium]|nr:trigger factor [Clostridiaceae bacterium]